MTPANESIPAPLRVLVVENDPQWRADLLANLRRWGYAAWAAEPAEDADDPFQSLWGDAIYKAKRHRCHLAVVDMRLKNDDDTSDTSGLDLVQYLAPTVSIIVSGHGDARTVRAALKSPPEVPQRAYDFVGKEDGPEAMRTVIKETIGNHWSRLLKGKTIRGCYSIPSATHISRHLFQETEDVPTEEIEDLLWRLFPDATQLSIEDIENSDRTPSGSVRPRSLVIRVKEDEKRYPDIVKIARADRSQDEFVNFHDHVEGKFPKKYYASLKDVKSLWDVRGARYEHVGNWGKMTLFSTYYRTKQSDAIRRVLQTYGTDWKDHYVATSGSSEGTLFEAFTKVWGQNWKKRLTSSSASLQGASPEFRDWFMNELGLDDPILWLQRHLGLDDVHTIDSSPRNVPIASLHGDLQGDNCFVDEEHHNLWLIDFERSGPGPILEDLVELEIDILTRLCCFSRQDRRDFLKLVSCVLSPTPSDFWAPARLETGLPEAVKALNVIREIRKQVCDLTGLDSRQDGVRLYRWTMLLNAAFRVTLPTTDTVVEDEPCDLSITERCILLGGVICQSLRLSGQWPPANWKHHLEEPYPPSLDTTMGRHYALLIGVGSTPCDVALSLPTTVNDVEAIQTILIDPAACAYPPNNVHVLCNATASLPRIRDEFDWLIGQTTANPDSMAIVYFSGHGGRLQGDNRYFLVPSDFDPGKVAETVLWAEELTQRLNSITAKRVLVLIDACHAAAMTSAKEVSLLQGLGFVGMPPPSELLKSWQQGQSATGSKTQSPLTSSLGEGRTIISSSRTDQSSYIRKDATLSIFTYHLREALRGDASKPGENPMTVSTLIGHVSKTVPESALRDWNRLQVPWIDLKGEDFQIAMIARVADSVSKTPVIPDHSLGLFYSYSHKDEQLRNRLENHLSLLSRQGVIANWHDRRISAGREWEGTIDDNLRRADIILLLISADFLASDYCYDVEMKIALDRHAAGKARVIPIILRAVEWQRAPFGKLLALPSDGKPIMEWRSKDRAFQDVARGIREIVDELQSGQA